MFRKKVYKNGIAVDFDGTLFRDRWPEIGKPRKRLIKWLIRQQKKGTPIILWTCRQGRRLQTAISACRDQGLEFNAVNDNPFSEFVSLGASRKIHADLYIDDKSKWPWWLIW
jgi:hypothetical protein